LKNTSLSLRLTAWIFERFFRAGPSRSEVEGAGLGLAIAKWIADTHRAALSVQSSEGEGTVFAVVFPLLAD
jgi:signal transduction histidine kinase